MKKGITIFVLIVIILLAFGFVSLKISALGEDDSFFNSNLRQKFSKSGFLRQILSLRNSGDAKSDYVGGKNQKIVIEIDSMSGLEIKDDRFLGRLAEKIASITGKQVSYTYSDSNIAYEPFLTDNDLRNIEKDYRNYIEKDQETVLYMLIVSQLKRNQDRLGSTLGNSGIVLFKNTLLDHMKDYEANDYDEIFESFIISTLLHEFGHQVGLPHHNVPDCLMYSKAEFREYMDARNIATDFCEFEKNGIKI